MAERAVIFIIAVAHLSGTSFARFAERLTIAAELFAGRTSISTFLTKESFPRYGRDAFVFVFAMGCSETAFRTV